LIAVDECCQTLIFCQRQDHCDGCSDTDFAHDADAIVMQFNDALCDGEAHTCGWGLLIGLDYFFQALYQFYSISFAFLLKMDFISSNTDSLLISL
jgi:hypothetical protein